MNMFNLIPSTAELELGSCENDCTGCNGCDGCRGCDGSQQTGGGDDEIDVRY